MKWVEKYEVKVKEVSTNLAPLNVIMFHMYYCSMKIYLPNCSFFTLEI